MVLVEAVHRVRRTQRVLGAVQEHPGRVAAHQQPGRGRRHPAARQGGQARADQVAVAEGERDQGDHDEQGEDRRELDRDEHLQPEDEPDQGARDPRAPVRAHQPVVDQRDQQREQREEHQEQVQVPLPEHVGREPEEQTADEGRRARADVAAQHEVHRQRRQREPDPQQQVERGHRSAQRGDGPGEQPQERHRGVHAEVHPGRRVEVGAEQRVLPVRQRERHPAQEPRLLHRVAAGAGDDVVGVPGQDGPVGEAGEQQVRRRGPRRPRPPAGRGHPRSARHSLLRPHPASVADRTCAQPDTGRRVV